VTVTAAAPGVTGTLVHTGSGSAAILVATVPPPIIGNVTQGTGRTLTASYDVRALGVTDADFAIVTFQFFDLNGNGDPVINIFAPDPGPLEPLLIPGVVDLVHNTVTTRFDAHTTPPLRALRGTVFTISVAQFQPIFIPPPAPSGPAAIPTAPAAPGLVS